MEFTRIEITKHFGWPINGYSDGDLPTIIVTFASLTELEHFRAHCGIQTVCQLEVEAVKGIP